MSRELDDLEREFADLEHQTGAEDGGPPRGGRSGLRTLPIAVAVIALLVFGGIVYYAYNQGVRSGSEEAAPLLAPQGEAKVQPSDPGGMEIAHTDKEVFNRISGDEEDPGRVERILPPPEDPMQPPAPEPEDAPSSATGAPEVQTPALPSITDNSAQSGPTQPGTEPVPPLPDEKLAEPGGEPPTAAPAPSGESGGQAASAPSESDPASEPEAQPAPEPEPEQAAPAPEPEPAPAPEPEPQTAAADPTSGWQVQIAALSSEADARAAWQRAQSAHGAQLGDLSLAVQRAVVNEKTYYRVRGGPLSSREVANAVCTALKAKDQPCLVVRPGG